MIRLIFFKIKYVFLEKLDFNYTIVTHFNVDIKILLFFQAALMGYRPNNIPLTISLEGIIGAGKSHCLSYLSTYEAIEIQHEPVEAWQNWMDINLLDIFYRDPYTYGYLFQNYVQLTMLERHLQPPQNNIRVMERSIFSAHHVFQRQLAETLEIDGIENSMLTTWFNLFTKPPLQMHLDLIVYIKVDPVKALERIKIRNRPEEQFITLDYLETLDYYHNEWLDQIDNKVIIINGNKSKDEMPTEYNKIIEAIMTMLN
jgi:deoxynucleoside kinase